MWGNMKNIYILGDTLRYLVVTVLISLLLLLNGCSGVQVSQDYRPGNDFSRLQSYRWKPMSTLESKDPRVDNPMLQERFRQAIDGTLAVRGYVQAASADFVVGYEYSVQSRLESDNFSTGLGYGWGSYDSFGGVGIRTGGGVRQYDVGVLVINFSDARTGEPLWRGTGTEMVTLHSTPEDTTTFVYRMVDSVLSQFPPR